jgi:hypothetical protein
VGTQQLLLLVLAAIIVGVGIAVAIAYFRSGEQETAIDEAINELNHISSAAQGWYRKPFEFDGGNRSFDGFGFEKISQSDSSDVAKYTVISAKGNLLSLKAIGYSDFTIYVNIYPDSVGNFVVTRR